MACSAALSPCSEACQCPRILALTWASPSTVALLVSAGRAGLPAPGIVTCPAASKLPHLGAPSPRLVTPPSRVSAKMRICRQLLNVFKVTLLRPSPDRHPGGDLNVFRNI